MKNGKVHSNTTIIVGDSNLRRKKHVYKLNGIGMVGQGRDAWFMPRAEVRRMLRGEDFTLYHKTSGIRYSNENFVVERDDKDRLHVGCHVFSPKAERVLRQWAGVN